MRALLKLLPAFGRGRKKENARENNLEIATSQTLIANSQLILSIYSSIYLFLDGPKVRSFANGLGDG